MPTDHKSKYGITLYKNGFEIRRQGRRITYLETDGGWRMTFHFARVAQFTAKDKLHFDQVVERLGLTYTIKQMFISKEAMEDIAAGMMGYIKHVDNKITHLYP